jgi:hypothetical protein
MYWYPKNASAPPIRITAYKPTPMPAWPAPLEPVVELVDAWGLAGGSFALR